MSLGSQRDRCFHLALQPDASHPVHACTTASSNSLINCCSSPWYRKSRMSNLLACAVMGPHTFHGTERALGPQQSTTIASLPYLGHAGVLKARRTPRDWGTQGVCARGIQRACGLPRAGWPQAPHAGTAVCLSGILECCVFNGGRG